MKELAIMVPRTDVSDLFQNPAACCPATWAREEFHSFPFPESCGLKSDWWGRDTLVPAPWPRDTADRVEKLVFTMHRARGVIVTRSAIVILRVQRIIVTSGADLKAAVYIVGSKEMDCYPIGADGSFTWPHAMFLDEWAYARTAVIAGKDEATACGIGLSKGSGEWNHLFRVTSKGAAVTYRLDRWD